MRLTLSVSPATRENSIEAPVIRALEYHNPISSGGGARDTNRCHHSL
jgi:hypothetical protein